jgi:crotonobetainyl-CoA:carnitine CoA-transferase CaiB-like acyl-CoA transferase
MSRPLEGIRVVEQGTFITGPCCGMMLADLGADVIKLEASGSGDPYRSYQGGHYSPHFQAYNRNKRTVALDLKDETQCALRDTLVREADVFIQNFRPGAAERLGAGAARLQELNPRLVYCSISGFGSSGPYVERPSYDSVAQGLSGFLSVVVDRDRPRFLGPALADAITGIYAAYGILGALVERGRTGKGRHVEVSMLEAMAHFAVEPFAAFFALGDIPSSSDRPRLAQAYILRASDGGLIAIHLSSLEKFWQELTSAIGAEHLRTDPRFEARLKRIANYEALAEALGEVFKQRPRAAWEATLSGHDVPFAPVNTIDEVVDDPQAKHLGLIVPVTDAKEGGHHAVRSPVNFDGERVQAVRPAPLIDEHGEDIRTWIKTKASWPIQSPHPQEEAP